MASLMNTHCQPLSPRKPSIYRIDVDSGEPITVDTEIAPMNMLTMRAR